jgi:hypothetical protein
MQAMHSDLLTLPQRWMQAMHSDLLTLPQNPQSGALRHTDKFISPVGWKNSAIWDISTAVTMNDIVFWDMASCGSNKNRCLEGTYRLHLQGG